jgi:TonB family protein
VPAHARTRKPLAQPQYPASALEARVGQQVVYVTFTVDATGHITDIRPSWDRIVLRSKFSDIFFQAVSDTIAKWDMEPVGRSTGSAFRAKMSDISGLKLFLKRSR